MKAISIPLDDKQDFGWGRWLRTPSRKQRRVKESFEETKHPRDAEGQIAASATSIGKKYGVEIEELSNVQWEPGQLAYSDRAGGIAFNPAYFSDKSDKAFEGMWLRLERNGQLPSELNLSLEQKREYVKVHEVGHAVFDNLLLTQKGDLNQFFRDWREETKLLRGFGNLPYATASSKEEAWAHAFAFHHMKLDPGTSKLAQSVSVSLPKDRKR